MINVFTRSLMKLKNINYIKRYFLRHQHRVFSGIQPTGVPHLGNYFGAIKTWQNLQTSHSCMFCIVDLHSITLPQDPQILRQNIHTMTACLLACGIDSTKSILFLQSQVCVSSCRIYPTDSFENAHQVVGEMLCTRHVPQHSELAWILGCLVTVARLAHLPQYKEKSKQVKEVPLGLYVYPVLQSADILLYKSNKVPVGEDQIQHIQLAQHLARIFNAKYKDIFPVPEALLDEKCGRIKSLRQPDKKMSKSDANIKNRIELTDSPDIIMERIKKSLTDFTSAVSYDPKNRPGISNLLFIHSLCSGLSPSDICHQYQSLDTGQYKEVVGEALIEYLKPIQTQVKYLLSDPVYLADILKQGSDKATAIAHQTMNEVKELVGLSSFGINDTKLNLRSESIL